MKINLFVGIAFLSFISSCSNQSAVEKKSTFKKNSEYSNQIEPPAVKAKVPAKGLSRPPYPTSEFGTGNQGTTKFNLHLGADGKIKAIYIKESTASKGLNDSFIEWVPKNWSFIPCENSNQKPVECMHEITYVWKIENK